MPSKPIAIAVLGSGTELLELLVLAVAMYHEYTGDVNPGIGLTVVSLSHCNVVLKVLHVPAKKRKYIALTSWILIFFYIFSFIFFCRRGCCGFVGEGV